VLDAAALDAETASDYAQDLSVALMLTLERLSPLERAAFLLHDVFDMDFGEIAEALGRSEAACRQLAARSRAHLRAARPRFAVLAHEGARLAAAFRAAAVSGDAAALARLLAEDAVLHTDGGGKRPAALNPIYGRDKILRFLAGLARKDALIADWQARPARNNALPGFVLSAPDGARQTIAFEIRDEKIAAIYVVLNPEKLQLLG
jgi:RNA polymerase sigma-70 factor, ECF subfamily